MGDYCKGSLLYYDRYVCERVGVCVSLISELVIGDDKIGEGNQERRGMSAVSYVRSLERAPARSSHKISQSFQASNLCRPMRSTPYLRLSPPLTHKRAFRVPIIISVAYHYHRRWNYVNSGFGSVSGMGQHHIIFVLKSAEGCLIGTRTTAYMNRLLRLPKLTRSSDLPPRKTQGILTDSGEIRG